MHKSGFSLSVKLAGNKPVFEYPHNGETFIEGRKGSEFSLTFRNDTARRVLVVPAIDGISTLDGKTAGDTSPGFIVGPNTTLDIPGWMVDQTTAAKFLFSDKDKGYGGSGNANAGVIGVLVFYEENAAYDPLHYVGTRRVIGNNWPSKSQIPGWNSSTDGIMFGNASLASPDMGTGWGKATNFETTKTEFNKGPLADKLVIYYGSKKYLESIGIVFEKRYDTSVRPNAFPNYGCTPPVGWKR